MTEVRRKRVRNFDDSDSDTESERVPSKKVDVGKTLSSAQKEERLRAAQKIEPEYDTLDVIDGLVRNNWDVALARAYLKSNCKKLPSKVSSSNGNHHHSTSVSNGHRSSSSKSSDSKRRDDYKSSRHSDAESNDDDKPSAPVYDSDEEDDIRMTQKRKQVIDFFNTGSASDLQSIKSLSLKKAEALEQMRPFHTWSDLVKKIKSSKHFSTDILNNTQEFLAKRASLSKILKKCQKCMERLEYAIKKGAGVKEQPSILNPSLKLAEYQIVGLNWLAVMHSQDVNAILADEMGLGKTIQVIAFLAYLKETQQAKNVHLIVVPASTLENWDQELNKWCPDLKVAKYYGSQDDRKQLRISWSKREFKGIDVILSTYNVISSTPEERKMFRVTKMHYIIFDEAHMLKNMTSQRYSSLINLNGERRILLTGTPLQNNLIELMSLLCFTMPSIFQGKVSDIATLFQKKGTKTDAGNEVSTFESDQINQAQNIMKPFVLRRLKKEVLTSLPQKIVHTIKIKLTEHQKEQYNELVTVHTSDSGIVKATEDQNGSAILMDMRKLANHPLLMRYYFSDEKLQTLADKLAICPEYKKTNSQYIFEELVWKSDFQIYQLAGEYNIKGFTLPDELVLNSGKFEYLDEFLPKLKKEGRRVLIFSQFVMMLDILEEYLQIREHKFLRFDGSTSVVDRQPLIDEFTRDESIFVFLLSTKAGGLGINLTAADSAIIHDIDYNPYNDKQAEDRCHRIGQKKDVNIYRLISESTIEEGMMMIAEEKLNLEKEVTGAEKDSVEHKCMVRLLRMALGDKKIDDSKLEVMLSPSPKKESSHLI